MLTNPRSSELSTNRLKSISAVRQHIRQKLIQVGLDLDVQHRRAEHPRRNYQKYKERPHQTQNLPILQSQQHKQPPIGQLRIALSHHCEHSQRQGARKFSHGRSKKHTKLLQSARQDYQYERKKEQVVRNSIECVQGNEELIPWLKRFQIYKQSKHTQLQPLDIIRLFENNFREDARSNKDGQFTRRSKTEERQCKKTARDKAYEIRLKDLAPWEFQVARDTRIHFQ